MSDSTTHAEPGITVRPFQSLREMSVCIGLQRRIWNYAEIDIVPEHIFVLAVIAGGQALGAFNGETAVGFSLAIPAVTDKHLHLHSHLVAVLPDYENRGIGCEIKLAQRADAIARGFDLIEWTFDPLQIRNAHFNIAKLGAIVRRYLPDLYGSTTSPLHSNLPTDRLVAEWWISSAWVDAVLANRPKSQNAAADHISLPLNLREICRTEPEKAIAIQSELRQHFQRSLARGNAAVGFELFPDHASYLMDRHEN